jgi:hypothetical protein
MANSVQETVNTYYESWRQGGRFCPTLFYDEFAFIGPIDRFFKAEDFMAMARKLGPAVRDVKIIKQFTDGEQICSIFDFETNTPVGTIPCVEWIRVKDGRIASIQLFYDARDLAAYLGR